MASGARERGPRGVTRPGARGFHAATPSRGLRKLRCLLPGQGRSFQSPGLWLSQHSLFIWLRGARSIPQRAPGSPECSSVAAQGIGLGFPVPRAPAACPFVWEELFPLLSVWLKGMLGVFLAQAPEGFPSLRSQQGGRLHPLHPHPTPAFRSWNCLLDRLGGIWLCCCFKCC